jgi:hypothetical protein
MLGTPCDLRNTTLKSGDGLLGVRRLEGGQRGRPTHQDGQEDPWQGEESRGGGLATAVSRLGSGFGCSFI